MAALVVAGDRAAGGQARQPRGLVERAGSADVLEALGVRLTSRRRRWREVAGAAGITFCFAQAFHPSMRHAAVARRELGVRHRVQLRSAR